MYVQTCQLKTINTDISTKNLVNSSTAMTSLLLSHSFPHLKPHPFDLCIWDEPEQEEVGDVRTAPFPRMLLEACCASGNWGTGMSVWLKPKTTTVHPTPHVAPTPNSSQVNILYKVHLVSLSTIKSRFLTSQQYLMGHQNGGCLTSPHPVQCKHSTGGHAHRPEQKRLRVLLEHLITSLQVCSWDSWTSKFQFSSTS